MVRSEEVVTSAPHPCEHLTIATTQAHMPHMSRRDTPHMQQLHERIPQRLCTDGRWRVCSVNRHESGADVLPPRYALVSTRLVG